MESNTLNTIRQAAYACFRPKVTRPLGNAVYQWIARQVSKKLNSVEGVAKVYVRGGFLSDCVPAISDIDLTLILEEESYELILALRKTYASLKRKYPVVGEVLACDRLTWNELTQHRLPLFLLCQNQIEIAHPSQNGIPLKALTLSDKSRFSICFQYYRQALDTLRLSMANPSDPIPQVTLRRLAKKILKYAGTQQPDLPNTSSTLLAMVFHRLDALSKSFAWDERQGTATEASLQSTVSQCWQEAFIQTTGLSSLEYSGTPFIYLWKGTNEPHEVRRTINALIRFLRTQPSFTKIPFYFVSRAMLAAYRKGWHGWSGPSLNLHQEPDQATLERARMHTLTLPGEFIYAGQDKLVSEMNQFYQEVKKLNPSLDYSGLHGHINEENFDLRDILTRYRFTKAYLPRNLDADKLTPESIS